MDQFNKIIDSYFTNYESFEEGKVSFECNYGELVFYKKNQAICILNSIYIFPQYRQKGLCRNILQYIIDKCSDKFTYFCVESVMSKILYMYLLRFTYNNKIFTLDKRGFIYKI